MSQVLWNVCSKKVEGRYDGKFYVFAPGERKIIRNDDVANFLIVQLEMYGVVGYEEAPTKEIENKAHVLGLRNRWKYCHGIVKNWETQNKEREAGKVGAASPTPLEEECAIEMAVLKKQIDELDQNRFSVMQEALKNSDSIKAAEIMKDSKDALEADGVELKMNRKVRPQHVASSPGTAS